jgi:hypothetical protein
MQLFSSRGLRDALSRCGRISDLLVLAALWYLHSTGVKTSHWSRYGATTAGDREELASMAGGENSVLSQQLVLVRT